MFKRLYLVLKSWLLGPAKNLSKDEAEAVLAAAQKAMREVRREKAILAAEQVVRSREMVKLLEAQDARLEKQIAIAKRLKSKATVRQLQGELEAVQARLSAERRALEDAHRILRQETRNEEQILRARITTQRLERRMMDLERTRMQLEGSQFSSGPPMSKDQLDIVLLVVINLILLLWLMLQWMK